MSPRDLWIDRLIAPLLHLANARRPHTNRERQAFYALKDPLLQRYGQRTGEALQEITRSCYGCDGTGGDDEGMACSRCHGTGVYDRCWVRLACWQLGPYTFHRPIERRWIKPSGAVTIHGRIQHPDVGRAGDEALLWLALLDDRGLWWQMVSTSWPGRHRWPYPLLMLHRAVWPLISLIRTMRPWQRCQSGDRRVRRWPWDDGVWWSCRRCRRRASQVTEDEIPL
jgi:hypothetical protein